MTYEEKLSKNQFGLLNKIAKAENSREYSTEESLCENDLRTVKSMFNLNRRYLRRYKDEQGRDYYRLTAEGQAARLGYLQADVLRSSGPAPGFTESMRNLIQRSRGYTLRLGRNRAA